MVVFCIEYGLRLWTSDQLFPDKSKGKAVLAFMISYDGIVELLTILPFFFLNGLVAFRMLRVVRIFHLFRISAVYDSFNVITYVFKQKLNQILSSVFIILVLILAASLSIYSVEHPVQPDVYKNAFSGIWWSMATIFTIGYGDIYPITIAGRILTIVITFLGVGAVAIPTGIISAGFVEQYTSMKNSEVTGIADVNHAHKQAIMTVGENVPVIGKTIPEVEEKLHIRVLVLVRHGDVVLISGNTLVRQGDVLVYVAG
ncbi:MAG: ion transporter [Lachnospiraceae bacterium]|nr:ion transporter [Candidatus Equihabitans merdae]